jgi:hypothetical protein
MLTPFIERIEEAHLQLNLAIDLDIGRSLTGRRCGRDHELREHDEMKFARHSG